MSHKVVTYLVLYAINIVFSGLLLAALWAWFVVPLGAPEIGAVHALGLGLITGMMTMNVHAKDEETTPFQRATISFVYKLMVLGFGAMFHAIGI